MSIVATTIEDATEAWKQKRVPSHRRSRKKRSEKNPKTNKQQCQLKE